MSDKSKIEWTDATWNPVRGCSRVSEGCRNCYAERMAGRFSGPGLWAEGLAENTPAGPRWTGRVELVPDKLDQPLRWKTPRRVFVNSMSDLFHENLPNEAIAAVFGVMAACPQHTFQVLTKRPERMREWFALPGIAERVDQFRHIALAGRIEEYFAPERFMPIYDWPGYWVTSKGKVQSFQKDERRDLTPMLGEQGHARVMLYRDGESSRLLVHHLALAAFDKPRQGKDQGCHITGDASNNALWNLRWGTQVENWDDSKRHGTHRRYHKLSKDQADEIRRLGAEGVSGAELGRRFGISDTQARNIVTGKQWVEPYRFEWPLSSVWLGTSVEDQATADARIPVLLATPAVVRFVSAEPLLGPVNMRRGIYQMSDDVRYGTGTSLAGIDWLICGGESGPGARPMHPSWARMLRDQCAAAGVAFFMKQMGSLAGREHHDIETFPPDLRVRRFPGGIA